MAPFGFGRKEQPQSFTTNITDKEDLEEIYHLYFSMSKIIEGIAEWSRGQE